MLRVLRVSPAPIGARRLAVLSSELGGDIDVVQFYGGSVVDIAAAARSAGAAVVALDCAPGIDPDTVAALCGAIVLRPVFVSVKNRHGTLEHEFSHYTRTEAVTAA